MTYTMSSSKRSKGMSSFSKRLKSQMALVSKTVKAHEAILKQTIEAKQIYRQNSDVLAQGDFRVVDILDGLAQGTADTGTGSTVQTGARIGNSINMKSITARIILNGVIRATSPANPTAKTTGVYRVLIYNSSCGEPLDQTHLLAESQNTFNALRSHYKIDVAQGKMYNIWYDRTFELHDNNAVQLIKFKKKWKNGKQVLYDGNNTLPSNFRPRMLVICEDVPLDGAYVSYSFKCRFEDL